MKTLFLTLLIAPLAGCGLIVGDAFDVNLGPGDGGAGTDGGSDASPPVEGSADVARPDGPTACDGACPLDTGTPEGSSGDTSTCGPGSCAGCCSAGQCVPMPSNAACGSGGNACAPCGAGTECLEGACTGLLVLFGGEGMALAYLNDTWEWDGTSWTQRMVTGPSGRRAATAASLNGTALVIGGFSSGGPLGDTWGWDGTSWTLLTAVGLTPRAYTAAATLGGKVILFGGYDGTGYHNGTWQWDGTTWTDQMPMPSPAARDQYAAAALGSTYLLFGGFAYDATNMTSLYFGDTETWNGTSWTAVTGLATYPPPRYGAAAATLNGKVVLFGGDYYDSTTMTDTYYSDTWLWDGTSWGQVGVSGPTGRYGATMATFGGKVLLFGGDGPTGLLGDTWEWDGMSWTQRSATGPSARTNAAMTAR